MQYFTPDLWLSLQSEASSDEARLAWERAFAAYREQLNRVRDRLASDVFAFFSDVDVHDGELLTLAIKDGSRPAPFDGPPEEWQTRSDWPVEVLLQVLDAYDRYIWTLNYRAVRSIAIDYPGTSSLFFQDGTGFGDWGYHELTESGADVLRHEILFASGATIRIEFQGLTIQKAPRA